MQTRRDRRQPLVPEARPERGTGPRRLRLGEELRHALSHLLRPGECRDPALYDANITVSEVTLSPDLRKATAFVIPLGGAKESEIMAGLKRSTPYLRGRLAREVSLRRIPEIAFALDRSFEHAERIAALLAQPDVKRDLGRTAGAGQDEDDG
ncbi:MAG TPA: 30S ribosome-binding factor RbfA [Stellaceae bacterium]|nr:30S ribosome-binding factor RbfA [Stellaceae bacterium]